MPRARKKLILTQPIKEGLKAIKVRLDHRTIITIASMKALDFWKARYPKAECRGTHCFGHSVLVVTGFIGPVGRHYRPTNLGLTQLAPSVHQYSCAEYG